MKILKLALCATLVTALAGNAAVQVGSGSYLTVHPGGEGSYPNYAPNTAGNAAAKPVPTSDWWTPALMTKLGGNFFNYPMAFRPEASGLVMMKSIVGGGAPADSPLRIGLQGLSVNAAPVVDHSDWTVTLQWGSAGNSFQATIGQCMPFVYFTKESSSPVEILVTQGAVSVNGNIALIKGSFAGGNLAVYAPSGATWTLNGTTLTSTLGGKNYWSVALLPDGASVDATASDWVKYAYAFPADTQAVPAYDKNNGKVTTTYKVIRDVKEGADNGVILGLLPHQWANLSGAAPAYQGIYATARGEMRAAPVKEYTTSLTFSGILPMLPAAMQDGNGYSTDDLKKLVKKANQSAGFGDFTDSYNDGQLMNRLVQVGNAAYAAGDMDGFNKALSLVKERLERWLTAQDGEQSFVLYYHKPWNAMLPYRPGHGVDVAINDHHFHFGYFITAAAFVAAHDASWAADWAPIVNLLVRDAASIDRNDDMFPYLRNFSPYSGHAWAGGLPTFGPGNNQESSSEAMMFNSALILWGEVTGNTAVRDAGVWMYATERSAIEEYWFDVNKRNLGDSYQPALACRVFTNSFDSQNFWGGGLAGSYGIQIYPVQPSSTYLVNNPKYAEYLWNAMKSATDIDTGASDNANVWYDAWIQHLAMIDPAAAIELYNKSISKLGAKFGASRALTYYWVSAMAAIGTPAQYVTANHPLANAFRKGDTMTYCAYNYGDSPVTVTFSDGHTLSVAAHSSNFDTARTSAAVPSYYDKGTGQTVTPALYTGTSLVAQNPDLVVPEVTVAAPAPTRDASLVKSIYSGKYESVVPGLSIGNWNQSTVAETALCGGDEAYLFSDFNYLGFEFNDKVDVADMTTMHIDVYATVDMTLKLLPLPVSGEEQLVSRQITAGKWNSFDIPMSEFPNVKYGQLDQFKFDGGSGNVVYIDNLYFYKENGGTTPDTPDDPVVSGDPGAAPVPSRAAADVKSFYSGAYTPEVDGMFFANWGGTNTISEVACGGDNAMKAEGFQWMGTQFPGDITTDVSDMDHFHIDFYAPVAMSLNVYPISLNPTIESDKQNVALAAGTWTSLDFKMSDFPSVDFTKFGQFKFDGGNGQTFYADNLYFYKENGGNTPVDPDPVDPEPEPEPDVPATIFTTTSSEAVEGSFKTPWTLSFIPDGNTVKVVVYFGPAGTYADVAGPWLHNVTNGFQELNMVVEDASKPSYSYTFYNVGEGETLKVRSKIAYNGGLGVTADCTYVHGQQGSSTVLDMISGEGAHVTVYNLQGFPVLMNAPKESLRDLPTGFYIVNGRKLHLK